MSAVFVDSSAFVALVDRRDRHHASARRHLGLLEHARRRLVTTTYIADEVITVVRMRINHSTAVATGEALFSSKWCELHDVHDDIRMSAWSLFVRYKDQRFSFTDCTSFALMHAMGLEEAFTFDVRDFSAAGFTAGPARRLST